MPASRALKLAKKAPSSRLSSVVNSKYELSSTICQVKVLHSNELKMSQRDSIWALFEANMRELYANSSFGWDPAAKRKELFHSLSRFILVYEADTVNLMAFTMFRFENEEEEDIIYCYDLQVTSAAQGMGLGKKIVNELANLSEAYHMEKIFLTVLKANTKARGFYKATGFNLDPTSPGYVGEGEELDPDEMEEVDYEILSKVIQPN